MALTDNDKSKQSAAFIFGFFQQVREKAADLEQYHNRLMDAVWAGGFVEVKLPSGRVVKVQDGLTPEEKIAALGTEAAAAFGAANLLAQAIVAADPSAAGRLKTVPAEYAGRLGFAQDGSVTVAPAA
jgi:hypothetical protein